MLKERSVPSTEEKGKKVQRRELSEDRDGRGDELLASGARGEGGFPAGT